MVSTQLLMCENMGLMPGGFGHYEHHGQSGSWAVWGVTNAERFRCICMFSYGPPANSQCPSTSQQCVFVNRRVL